jgi:hypothetical protein
MSLEDEVEEVVRNSRKALQEQISGEGPAAIGRELHALTESLLDGLKFLARHIGATTEHGE